MGRPCSSAANDVQGPGFVYNMDESKAATTIQAYIRGHLARKLYAQELFKLFEKEEAERRVKEQMQIQEGELLIERSNLQREIAEQRTLSENEYRKLNSMAIRIQRAWRVHKQVNQNALYLQQAQHSDTMDTSGLETSSERESDSVTGKLSKDLATVLVHPMTSEEVQPQLSTAIGDEPDVVNEGTIEYLELMKWAKSALLQQDADDFEETFESDPVEVFTTPIRHSSPYKKILTSGAYFPFTHAPQVYPSTHSHATISENTTFKTRSSTPPMEHPTSSEADDQFLHMPLQKYRLLYTIELSDSSEDGSDHQGIANHDHIPQTHQVCRKKPPGVHPILDHTNGYDTQVVDSHAPLPGSCMEDDNTAGLETGHVVESAVPACARGRFRDDRNKECASHAVVGTAQTLDHSFSPLHNMTTSQLRNLLQALEKKCSGTSMELIRLLEERDGLTVENDVLQKNIALQTRKIQDFYADHMTSR